MYECINPIPSQTFPIPSHPCEMYESIACDNHHSLMRCEMRWLKRSCLTHASLYVIINSSLVSMSQQLVPFLLRKGFSVYSSLNLLTLWSRLKPQKLRLVIMKFSFWVSQTIRSTKRRLKAMWFPQLRMNKNTHKVQMVHRQSFPQKVFSKRTLFLGSSWMSKSIPHKAKPTLSRAYKYLNSCHLKGRPYVSYTTIVSSVLRRSSKRMAERSQQVDFSYSWRWMMSSRCKLWLLSRSRIIFHTGSTLQVFTNSFQKSLNDSSPTGC